MIRKIGGARVDNMLVTACNVESTFQDVVARGDIVVMGTSSNWAINSTAAAATLETHGQVLDLSPDSSVATVRWFRGLGVARFVYGSAPSLGNIVEAYSAAASTVQGSANTTLAQLMKVVSTGDPSGYCEVMFF